MQESQKKKKQIKLLTLVLINYYKHTNKKVWYVIHELTIVVWNNYIGTC